jgi:hypothetical protein
MKDDGKLEKAEVVQEIAIEELDISDREMYRSINSDINLTVDEQQQKEAMLLKDLSLIIDEGFGSPLVMIEELVEMIISSSKLAYEYKPKPFSEKSVRSLTKIGKHLVPYFSAMVDCLDERFEYSEHVTAFFKVYRSIQVPINIEKQEGLICPPLNSIFYDRLVAGIREECASDDFRRRLSARRHNSVRNLKSVSELINALFRRYSRMLVLRVDLGYRKKISDEVNEISANEHRKDLLNNARTNSIFEHMVGYIWKLEYGKERGHHFHFAFFFDGSRVKQDAYIAGKIGKYWTEKITKGHGTHYNCNMVKYKRLGVGMVSHSDYEARKDMMFALAYLTKKEQYLRKKTSKKFKTFSTSAKPGPKTTRRGRKRKSPNEALSLSEY